MGKPAITELIKTIQQDLDDGFNVVDSNLTVIDLCTRYVATKIGVTHNTAAGYQTTLKELCDAYNIDFKELLKIKRNNPEYSEMEILSHFFQRVIYSMRDGSYLVSDKKDL